MRKNKIIILTLLSILQIGCINKKKEDKTPSEPNSTVYLEEVQSANPNIYPFRVVDRAKEEQSEDEPKATHAVAKEFFTDEDGGKFLGGTNPALSFHRDEEVLVVKTRLKSKPLPPEYRLLTHASQVKDKLTTKSEEEVAFLFTNRRLDLPFILIETYRGKNKISRAVNNLLNNNTETRTVEFNLRQKDTKDNPFSKLITLNLTSSLKEENLPKELIEYLKQ